MDGVLVIDKPAGPTSHDVVQIVKRITGAKKVGHLGTLDPAATGVLPLVINGATKRADELKGVEKVYEFTLVLGASTDTDDDQGKIVKKMEVPADAVKKLEAIIPEFLGEVMQRPPAFSAIKMGGRKSYEAARKGEALEIEPRKVVINKLSILDSYLPNVKMRLECNSGTYVRSLCRDLGEKLGCGGHASGIRRLKSGNFSIEAAICLDSLSKDSEIWKKSLLPIG
jgi:tRNA pseudouridine55 synthase